jgi:CRP/FNR family cyclic AMP-dependent transcriptional regulator
MEIEDLGKILAQHPFLEGLSKTHLQVILGCASSRRFPDGACLMHEGDVANTFYLIRSGRVALETDLNARGTLRIQTVGPGEVLGWSWLISPFRWHFSAYAVSDTRVIALDGECLRRKCENDHDFGFEMLRRLAQVMEHRLESTRLQLLDLYGMGTKDYA